MKSIEYGISHREVYGVFDEMSAGKKDGTVLGSSVGNSDGSYKGWKYDNLVGGVGGKVIVLAIWVV